MAACVQESSLTTSAPPLPRGLQSAGAPITARPPVYDRDPLRAVVPRKVVGRIAPSMSAGCLGLPLLRRRRRRHRQDLKRGHITGPATARGTGCQPVPVLQAVRLEGRERGSRRWLDPMVPS
eukprot:gene3558-biopygen23251